jgi:enoyl-[acyl-carrier protein] reductase I
MASANKKVALIMGVANNRSIAWGCVESFLQKDWDVVLTYQNERFAPKVQALVDSKQRQFNSNRLLVGVPCNVEDGIPELFSQRLPDILKGRKLNAIVHSVAHASNLQNPLLKTTLQDFLEAHRISAYSLVEVASNSLVCLEQESSITALSYLGAARAIPGYNVLGPGKASLEAIVRGLALELGGSASSPGGGRIRVNAVSAGPLSTLSAKGGISNFSKMRDEMAERAPLGNVTVEQVASTVSFLATEGMGITGQTIYVDGGYNIVGGPALDKGV